MNKLLKITAVAVCVLLAAALLLPFVFEGKIVETVKREANAKLCARLDFEKLDVSLLRHFPHASLDLKGLTLVGEERFEGDTIAVADRISVVVNVMSLFSGQGFEVTKVLLARPSVHARKLADGAVNWNVLKRFKGQAGLPEPQESSSLPSSFRLLVRDVRITDASVCYEDDSTQMRFSASPASFRLRGDLSAAESELDLRFRAKNMRLVSGGVPLLGGAEGELDAVIVADLEQKRFSFARNTLRLNAIEMALDGWADFSEPDAVSMDLTAGFRKVQFKDVLSMIPAFYVRDFRNLSASGELSLSAWARGRMAGNTVPAFEVKLGVKEGGFQYSSLPKAVTGINVEALVANKGGTMDDTKVEMPSLTLQMGGNSLRASFLASHPFTDMRFDASVSGHVDLGEIHEVYPLEKGEEFEGSVTADVRIAGRMSDIERQRYESIDASGTFVVEKLLARLDGLPQVCIRRAAASITPANMTLGELNVTVGRSDLTANGQLTDYIGYLLHGTTLSGRLYVKSDLLDLNEIMAPAETSGTSPNREMDVQEPSETASEVLVVPGNLNLALSSELHEVRFQKMKIMDFSGSLSMTGGGVTLDNLKMDAFGGRVMASGRYSTAADPLRPDLRLSLDMERASFQKTFEELETVRQFVPLFEKTGGSYSMKLGLTTRLDSSMSPDLKTLDAKGEIGSQDIRIQHIEAFSKLADALHYEPLREIEAKDVKIRFTVSGGRVATEPFDLRIGGAVVNLSGTTGLDRTIDYKARITLPAGAAGGVLTTLNVGIGGTFSEPKITLGVKEAAQEVLKNLVDEQVRKLTGSSTLEEEIGKQHEKLETAVDEQKERLAAEVRNEVLNLRSKAHQAGEKLVQAAEEQRAKLVAGAKNPLAKVAAEKAGDKLVAAAQEQAAKLASEAEARVAELMEVQQ